MQDDEEKVPLLGEKSVDKEDIPEDELPDDEDTNVQACILDVYEPVTKTHKSHKFPTPLLLLGICFGLALMELLGVFGAFLFLVTHAHTVFPKCQDRFDFLNQYVGGKDHAFLCEGSSWLLWHFPLFCCFVIPLFAYWEFTDQRLFYECLRQKILLKFPEKPFFTAPIIVLLIVWLILGLTTLLFGGNPGKDIQKWENMVIVIIPFLLPIISFFIQIFIAWDTKFFLITLSNFADDDVEWSQNQLKSCVAACEEDVEQAYFRLVDSGELPVGGTSRQVFGKLFTKLSEPGATDKAAVFDFQRWAWSCWERTKALIFFRKGFWMTDLLWTPHDNRAKQFRIALRVFAFGVFLIQAIAVYLMITTTILFMETQGHIEEDEVPHWVMWLRAFMIKPKK
jgi:hypothetical protein